MFDFFLNLCLNLWLHCIELNSTACYERSRMIDELNTERVLFRCRRTEASANRCARRVQRVGAAQVALAPDRTRRARAETRFACAMCTSCRFAAASTLPSRRADQAQQCIDLLYSLNGSAGLSEGSLSGDAVHRALSDTNSWDARGGRVWTCKPIRCKQNICSCILNKLIYVVVWVFVEKI